MGKLLFFLLQQKASRGNLDELKYKYLFNSFNGNLKLIRGENVKK